ncbi:uncharacterized protein [Macaca nemestrina]|uniref:uncharacterized protein isoform X1 n=1 Tax=Macaca nemestrina TaxID=9545 RepID=UPI0039B8C84C
MMCFFTENHSAPPDVTTYTSEHSIQMERPQGSTGSRTAPEYGNAELMETSGVVLSALLEWMHPLPDVCGTGRADHAVSRSWEDRESRCVQDLQREVRRGAAFVVFRPTDDSNQPPGWGVLSMHGLTYGVIRLDSEEKLSVLTMQDVSLVMPGGECALRAAQINRLLNAFLTHITKAHIPVFPRSHVPTFPRSYVPTFLRSYVPVVRPLAASLTPSLLKPLSGFRHLRQRSLSWEMIKKMGKSSFAQWGLRLLFPGRFLGQCSVHTGAWAASLLCPRGRARPSP